MRSQWSLGIRETGDLKGDSRILNEESIERSIHNRIALEQSICNKIAEERKYMEDL